MGNIKKKLKKGKKKLFTITTIALAVGENVK